MVCPSLLLLRSCRRRPPPCSAHWAVRAHQPSLARLPELGSLSRESSTVGNFPATERYTLPAYVAGRARPAATGELTSAHESCFSTLAAGGGGPGGPAPEGAGAGHRARRALQRVLRV